ncbi:oxidoreductase [Desulfobacter hydrogenophilus]|uniref:Oxidoreductase n=1 Tax=Desulfobacter hydrogenophilus TaxID=2291 RepID=A0A328F662_9BACT|nr:SDR family NAD(P)-dependent oxidoreductase [Desulfobacter hydrogenophilus]NDY74451.1 SDR family NAD(P)-dependent oxidoreductase [Desulfobacter hydrogenophilus]QBH14963.1 SDR family NAD(P)-dependent oxidoreductase [Desulfobacter hydrogenophilus]RAM00001.1 oxidoreductase [Desulfobacter hydrogenophilus]
MQKNILITGATDGIGLEAAKMLAVQGHNLIIHGRNPAKLADVEKILSEMSTGGKLTSYLCDLSKLKGVQRLGAEVAENHTSLDVLINNAGVFKVQNPVTRDGLDVRFAVNTIAPYMLTKKMLPLFNRSGRIVNLSSAAQAPVDTAILAGPPRLSDGEAYAQSKLALTMWSCHMGRALKNKDPAIIAVNPASFLGSKMVKEAYGVAGKDLSIGAEILCRAALSDEFASASGRYFDNDSGKFSSPHADALNDRKCEAVIRTIEAVLNEL